MNNELDKFPSFDDLLVEEFKNDPSLAKETIAEELAEYEKTGDIRYLLMTLNLVAKAKGWTQLEKETGLSRPTLYSVLSGKSTPKIDTLQSILKALGFGISFYKLKSAS